MVVDQVNLAGGIRFFVVAENQSPVSGYGQTPESLQIAFERMKPPSRKQAELVEILGRLNSKQKLAELQLNGVESASQSGIFAPQSSYLILF